MARAPALLLRYETPAQKAAYQQLRDPAGAEIRRLTAIIPFRDKWNLTASCIRSLLAQELGTTEMLILLVDNNSEEAETKAGVRAVLTSSLPTNVHVRYLSQPGPFNYSALNNTAVAQSADFKPDALLFINNDIELTDPQTVSHMATFLAATPSCGSVGCTLLYPDATVQHLFIFVGCKIVGAHPFKHLRLDAADPWLQSPRPVAAATAALLAMRASDFAAVGGFEEKLPSCYQDVDLALKLQQLGKTNWVLPRLTAIHHETQTRSPIHGWDEVRFMYDKWGAQLTENPYCPSEFSRWSEAIALSLGEGPYPWSWLARG